MSVNAPIKLPTNNMLLCFDAANDKSYIGEPTTNSAGAVHLGFTGDRWEKTTEYPNKGSLPFKLGTDVYRLKNGNNYWGNASEFNIQYNKTYTLSFWYWVNTTENIIWTNAVFGTPTGGSGQYNTVSTKSTDTFVTTNNTSGWRFGYVVFSTNIAVSGYTFFRGTYTGGGSDTTPTGNVYIANFQLEEKSHPTQYTNSSRSNTTGLVDLAKNYTLDLTNAAYDGNAKIYLSGGKAIKINSNSSLFSNTFTWSAWHYIIADGGTGYAGIFWAEGAVAGGSGYQFLLSYRNMGSNAYAHYRIGNATTGWGNTDTGTLISSMLNRWVHTAWTFNNGTTKIYINGAVAHTDTSRGAYNAGSDSPIYIGARNDLWGSINGYIDNVIYYNRALNDSEILKLYDSNRKRYGL